MESLFLVNNFNFEIKLLKASAIEAGSNLAPTNVTTGKDELGDGGFQECSGLEIEMDVQQIQEGGRNDEIGRASCRERVYAPV